jgi:hypothetical protein
MYVGMRVALVVSFDHARGVFCCRDLMDIFVEAASVAKATMCPNVDDWDVPGKIEAPDGVGIEDLKTACTSASNILSAVDLYFRGPTPAVIAVIISCTAAMVACVSPGGFSWQYKLYGSVNVCAIIFNVCVGSCVCHYLT